MDENKQSKFNMSQLILMMVNNMQIRAAEFYRNGSIDSWFFEWKNIKFAIVGKLTNDERESLDEKEKEIQKVLYVKERSVPLIEKYIITIQDLIEKHQIGLVDKGDETVFT